MDIAGCSITCPLMYNFVFLIHDFSLELFGIACANPLFMNGPLNSIMPSAAAGLVSDTLASQIFDCSHLVFSGTLSLSRGSICTRRTS